MTLLYHINHHNYIRFTIQKALILNLIGDHHGYHSEHHNSIAGFGGFGDAFKGFGGFGGGGFGGGGFGGFGKTDSNRKDQSSDKGAGGFEGEFSLVGPGVASDGNADVATPGFGGNFRGVGFRSPIENANKTSYGADLKGGSDSKAKLTTSFNGFFDGAFGGNLEQGSTNNRKGFGFDNYGQEELIKSPNKSIEDPPILEENKTGFFASLHSGGNPFGSFGKLGSPFESNDNYKRPVRDSDTTSFNVNLDPELDYVESSHGETGFGANYDSYQEENSDYNYENGESENPEKNEFYGNRDQQFYQESNSIDPNKDSGSPALFPFVGSYSFSDFGIGKQPSNASPSQDNGEIPQEKPDYSNIPGYSDKDVAADTPTSLPASTNSGFTNGKFGFGRTQAPSQGSSEYSGQNYEYGSNNVNAFNSVNSNGHATASENGGSGFPNFGFKKRDVPEPLHDAPTRKQLNFYPVPNNTASKEKLEKTGSFFYQDNPAFSPVIGSALPSFRE